MSIAGHPVPEGVELSGGVDRLAAGLYCVHVKLKRRSVAPDLATERLPRVEGDSLAAREGTVLIDTAVR
jgi:hypothetical protein